MAENMHTTGRLDPSHQIPPLPSEENNLVGTAEIRTWDGMEPIQEEQLHVPDNLDEIIPDSLRPAIPDRPDRGVFYIDGHPDLFLRTTYYADTFKGAERSWEQLKKSGINLVPYRISEYEGSPIVFTSRVRGIELTSALEQNPTDTLLDEVDSSWESLLTYLARCKKEGEPVATDLLGDPDQFMYGTIPGTTEPHLVRVDLTDEAHSVSDIADYTIEVLAGANAISYMERVTGRRLAKSREAMTVALELIEHASKEDYANSHAMDYLDAKGRMHVEAELRAVPNAVRYAITNHVTIGDDSPNVRDLPYTTSIE